MNPSKNRICRILVFLFMGTFVWTTSPVVRAADPPDTQKLYAKSNLVAWCIVPFDAAKRGPRQRAEMLQRLGLKKVAYDWRAEHVATFEEEILQYQKHGLEFFAFWGQHPEAFRLFAEYDLHPQIWQTAPSPEGETHEQRVAAAAQSLLPLVEATRGLGCQLGLYNHGGWGGEPRNMVAVCRYLQNNAKANHVGIVYNLHHGHAHIADFAAVLEMMKPYLICLNLNGMNDGAQPKILPLGSGQHDRRMMQTVVDSGYDGPIGIIDHRGDIDTEKSLRQNLDGLRKIVAQLRGKPQ